MRSPSRPLRWLRRIRWSSLRWPITGSTAARRRISRRMALVTRRTWPLIQTLNRLAAVALVAVDAAHCDTCELFEIGDDGTERVAVIGIAVPGLGMQHELPALGCGGRRGTRDFAAKLVRCPGLAFADALHLGGVQRVDLGTALTLLLMANPVGEIEQRTKAILKRRVALDLASDVTDDAAKPGAQEFEFSPGTLELVGMRVAPHHERAA